MGKISLNNLDKYEGKNLEKFKKKRKIKKEKDTKWPRVDKNKYWEEDDDEEVLEY